MYADPAGQVPADASSNNELDPSLPFPLSRPTSIPPPLDVYAPRGEPGSDGAVLCWPRPELTSLKLTERHVAGLDLRGATMLRCRISRVDLSHRDLTGADLRSVRGTGALLACAVLRDVDLAWADLREADLNHVDLTGANLMEANLARADLRGSHLAGARHLELACVRGAVSDATTTWPATFDPRAAGVISHSGDRPSPGFT